MLWCGGALGDIGFGYWTHRQCQSLARSVIPIVPFAGLPLGLLAFSDLLVALFSRRSASFNAWLLLHVCALFAACIGLLLGYMARASDHPKAELHQWLVVILPALVYLAPVLLALHSDNYRLLTVFARAFRKGPNDKA